MNRLNKEKYQSTVQKAILNYLQEYKIKNGFNFCINDEYDILVFTKHFIEIMDYHLKRQKRF